MKKLAVGCIILIFLLGLPVILEECDNRRKNYKTADNEGKKTGETYDHGTGGDKDEKAADRQHKTKEEDYLRRQTIIGFAAIGLSFLALIAAVWGYISLRDQTKAAWDAADSAKRQADAAERDAEAGERPIIMVTQSAINIPPTQGEISQVCGKSEEFGIYLKASIGNFGRSAPAIIESATVNSDFAGDFSAALGSTNSPTTPDVVGQVIASQASAPIVNGRFFKCGERARGDVWTHRLFFFYWGRIIFRDPRGATYTYGFARRYEPGGSFFKEAGGPAYNYSCQPSDRSCPPQVKLPSPGDAIVMMEVISRHVIRAVRLSEIAGLSEKILLF